MNRAEALPDQLLDVNAICDQRDTLMKRNFELTAERNNLKARNAELLEACKRVLVHGANEYEAEDILREVIAKNNL